MKKHISSFGPFVLTAFIAVGASYLLWGQISQLPGMAVYEGDGFTFEYPEELVSADGNLWTEEGYGRYLNPHEECSTCTIPYVGVRVTETESSLEQFIAIDIGLSEGDYETIALVTNRTVHEFTFAQNDFVKINTTDLHESVSYYTINEGVVYKFSAYGSYWDLDHLDELPVLLSTLRFE
jgi:hypothetical protein